MGEKYLTLKRDRQTKKLIGFLWQGDTDKNPKTQIEELIVQWNKSPEKTFDWELCEDKDICDLLKDMPKQRTIEDIYYMLEELDGNLTSVQNDLYDIQRTVKELKDMEE
jgi:hypothetical protein